MCVEFSASHDHYTQAQPPIDQGAGLGMDSFKAGQPDSGETAFSHPDGFGAIKKHLDDFKLSGQFYNGLAVLRWSLS